MSPGFKRRLRIYGIGVGLGIMLSWALLLRHRNTDDLLGWTPTNRLLDAVEMKGDTALSNTFYCELKCQGFDSEDWNKLLKDGKVDFEASSTHTDPKVYLFTYDTEKHGVLEAMVEFSDSTIAVTSVNRKGENKSCDCHE